jgi:HD superfamily phosphohydrolase
LTDVLRPSEIAIADLAVAALCHDLGHGPLSHAWERVVIGDHFDRGALCTTLGITDDLRHLLSDAPWHEITTAGLLLWKDGTLHQLLEDYDQGSSMRTARLLRGRYWLEYLPSLLSREVDVDRVDYIRRDTHQTGVAYGRFDLAWLISTCTVGEFDGRWVTGFDSRKAPRVIEQFLAARIALYDTVYCHRTVRAVEAMFKSLLKRLKDVPGAIDALPGGGAFAKSIRGEPLSQTEILQLDDYALFNLIHQIANTPGTDPILEDLAKRILGRDLFKMVPISPKMIEGYVWQEEAQEAVYEKLYRVIRPYCPSPAHVKYYLVHDDYSVTYFNEKPKKNTEDEGEWMRRHSSFLIDESRKATAFQKDEELSARKKRLDIKRLFTLDSCSEAVAKVIQD